jgi:hypothetical protein
VTDLRLHCKILSSISALLLFVATVGCQGFAPSGNVHSNRNATLASATDPVGKAEFPGRRGLSVSPRTISGDLLVSPPTINFGSVPAGATSSQTGTLIAGHSNTTVSSAAWSGEGYSLNGITFPLIVQAGQNVPFTVTFAPQASGNHSGSISFFSNASDYPFTQKLVGTGIQVSQHDVSLSWDPSTAEVLGYNIYRGEQSGGPYSKLNPSPEPHTSFTDSTVQSGGTYFYVATSIDPTFAESAYSNEARVDVPPR